MSKQSNFIKKHAIPAMLTQFKYGIPTSIVLAQAILESGWGESLLSINAKNYFGIKANTNWKGALYNAQTHEFYNDIRVDKVDAFRAYATVRQSFRDHGRFLKENKRYASLFKLPETDYVNWSIGLKNAGYATSPTYESKLQNIINQYGLSRYDKRVKDLRVLAVFGLFGMLAGAVYVYTKLNRK